MSGGKISQCMLGYGGSLRSYVVSAFSDLLLCRYFHWWRHVETSSDLLFRVVAGSARMMCSFSERQTSHRRAPHWYGMHCCMISHEMFSFMVMDFAMCRTRRHHLDSTAGYLGSCGADRAGARCAYSVRYLS